MLMFHMMKEFGMLANIIQYVYMCFHNRVEIIAIISYV